MEAVSRRQSPPKVPVLLGGSLPATGNEQQVKPLKLYKQQYKKTKGALSGVQSECNGIDTVKEVLSQVAGFDDMVKGYQQYCDQAQKKLQNLWKDTMPVGGFPFQSRDFSRR